VIGKGWVQLTIDGANRSSSATSYLNLETLSRPNLHVIINSRVSRLFPTNYVHGSTPKLTTVEFSQDLETFHRLTASKELILSSGTTNTPQILLNSGIGNTSYLSSLNILPLIDLPGVGQNLSVHPLLLLVFFVNSSFTTTDEIYQNFSFRNALVQEWLTTGMGPLVNHAGASHFTSLRFDERVIEEDLGGIDSSSGPKSPHFSFGVQNGFYLNPPSSGKYLTFLTSILAPTSRTF
jgi:choline dehydrogenase-like flavoprotein